MDLFFDLDGTLTDPARGITLCFQHTMHVMGRPAPETRDLLRYIGPPLRGTLAELLGTEDPAVIETAIAHYRERFAAVGMYENEVYPDVPAGLAELQGAGYRMWVVTSKPAVYAREIVEHFGLRGYFREVHGPDLAGRHAEKTALIAHVLEHERLDPENVWMIGDRVFDVAGGRKNGTRTIGVSWGYGSVEELREAGADAVVESMARLVEILGGSSSIHVRPGA